MKSYTGKLDSAKTLFMLCDVQEKFKSMFNFDKVLMNIKNLVIDFVQKIILQLFYTLLF